MAAYAALVSLMHIIEQLNNHPRPPICLDKSQVESLTQNITFLQDFLEGCTHGVDSKESEGLESRIADAAHSAEDIIESHIVDQILEETTTPKKNLYKGLQEVIEDMNFIKRLVMQIKEKSLLFQDHLPRNSTPEDSLTSSSFTRHNFMVGFDDEVIEIMNRLTGQQSNRQIIPIVGMGGIGKTTLAKNVYSNSLIQQHFDICAWTTISQEYNMPEILKEVLSQVKKGGRGDSSEDSELGVTLNKHLTGRRYLIVMDDMWSIDVWDKIKFFFPDNNNGSRIITTTRQSNLASQMADSYTLHLKFLDVDESWNLFCKVVFGEEVCPLELEETGKKIARGCKGLPLSISVIGGLLTKSKCEGEYWEYIAENLNSVVNLDDNERCLKILHMSYNRLPAYLKPCFLYVGIFPEDRKIRVSMLIDLWVAEGFLKPISGKSLEEVGREYFKGLIDRNLILVDEIGSTGNIKCCIIHDLLRDLCMRQAEKERFYNVMRQDSLNVPQGTNTVRRVVYPDLPFSSMEIKFQAVLQSMPLTRSLFYHSRKTPPLVIFRVLRIYKGNFTWEYLLSLRNMLDLVNLRYFAFMALPNPDLLSSIYRMWNLHTLIVEHAGINIALSDIWKMPQLRSVKFSVLELPDPPGGDAMDGYDIVLSNLHTLSNIRNFKCSEEIIKRIPNIKKLRANYFILDEALDCFFSNLDRLHKLESFHGFFLPKIPGLLKDLTFPHSLKKLTIQYFYSIDVLETIGSLPLLEKLKLLNGSFQEHVWETVEMQFSSLKFLLIKECYDLEYWITESTHFPCLTLLVLDSLPMLKEIPSEIGEIPTFELIYVRLCRDSVVES